MALLRSPSLLFRFVMARLACTAIEASRDRASTPRRGYSAKGQSMGIRKRRSCSVQSSVQACSGLSTCIICVKSDTIFAHPSDRDSCAYCCQLHMLASHNVLWNGAEATCLLRIHPQSKSEVAHRPLLSWMACCRRLQALQGDGPRPCKSPDTADQRPLALWTQY